MGARLRTRRRKSARRAASGKRRRAQRTRTAIAAVLVTAGLAVLAWLPASEAWDAYRRAKAADTALAMVAALEEDEGQATQELLAQASAYNAALAHEDTTEFGIEEQDVWDYRLQLSADGHDTAFGYVVIPALSLTMPIYHGTSEAALAAGAGHLESSSLPVGGSSTHAVVSAHSGLAGTRGFDDLDELEEGDVFAFVVLGQVCAYRVTSTQVVLPEETDSLEIVAGEDLATLFTCWPYGVNDHRLLVHGERCKPTEELLEYLELSAVEEAAASVAKSGRLVPLAAACGLLAMPPAAVAGRRAHRRRKARRRIRTQLNG